MVGYEVNVDIEYATTDSPNSYATKQGYNPEASLEPVVQGVNTCIHGQGIQVIKAISGHQIESA